MIFYILFVFGIFLLIRNWSVYKAGMDILFHTENTKTALDIHDKLPSYDAMLLNPKYWTLWTAKHWIAWIQRQEK